jgi:membrane-associated phospholipid phosphatase
MIALAFLFPAWRAPLLIFAAFISSTRIIVGAHYASDVVASAYIAFVVALVMRRWFERGGVTVRLQTT